MATLYANGWIATMDGEGSEHPDGWILVDGATVAAVGGGHEPEGEHEQPDCDPHQHWLARSHRATGGKQAGRTERVPPGHHRLRKRSIRSRKSGVVRAIALTRAPSRMLSAKVRPSSS